jgi:hypothetical protein
MFKILLNKNIVFYHDSRNIYVHLLIRNMTGNMIFVFVLTSNITLF